MNSNSVEAAREQLLTIFTKGLEAVNGRECVYRDLQENGLPNSRIWIVAIGKAASSMAAGAVQYLDSRDHGCRETPSSLAAGLLITKRGHAAFFDSRLEVLESDHPVPSSSSLEAGQRLVEFVSSVPEDETLLFLISGGTSALVEVLADSVSFEQLEEMNRWLLANPWPIHEINRVRQLVSRIKFGKLLDFINTDDIVQLTISDVADNDLSIIGSGLLVPVIEHAAQHAIELPDWLTQLEDMENRQSTASKTVRKRPKVKHRIIADNARARRAISEFARSHNLAERCNEPVAGEASAVSKRIAKILKQGKPGLYIWGGEIVVELPDNPGRGGRCQHLALQIAENITEFDEIVLLAVGTDGTDGATDVAGALVDSQTILRGNQLGLDSRDALRTADAGSYLEETGDLVDTGPTGTNVMDLLIGLKLADS